MKSLLAVSLVFFTPIDAGAAEEAADPSTTASPAEDPASVLAFEVEPVTDAAVLLLASGFGILSQLILDTGEITPQAAGDPSKLLPIDRPTALATDVEAVAKRTLAVSHFCFCRVDEQIVLTAAAGQRDGRLWQAAMLRFEIM